MKQIKIHWRIVGTVLGMFLMGAIHAQQPSQYTQYMYNVANMNPAYVGTDTRFEALALYRSQWTGIEGAPETINLGVNGSLGERTGLGVNFTSEKLGPSHQLDATAAFSYRIPTGLRTRLAFGVRAGVDVLDIDWSKGNYYDPNDIILNNNLNEVRPVIGAGALLYGENWYFGAAIPDVLSGQHFGEEEASVEREMYTYLMGGYTLKLAPQLLFKPAVWAKLASETRSSIDVSANFLIQDRLVVGGAYRFTDAMSVLAGIYLGNTFFIGYAFDYSVTGLNSYNDGSHEIVLKYLMYPSKKRAKSPRFF